MQAIMSPTLEELYANHYECRSNATIPETPQSFPFSQEEEELKLRICIMQRNLNLMKSKLSVERTLLQKEKQEMYQFRTHQDAEVAPSDVSQYSYRPDQRTPRFAMLVEHTDDRLPLSAPSKQQLRDIEKRCDLELKKLHDYVENIRDLKMYWQFLKVDHEINELGQEQSISSIEGQRRVHEGVPSADWLNRNRTFI